MASEPYKTTPVFDEQTLPGALRANHSTKAGVWGLLRVLEGEVRLVFDDPPREVRVAPGSPAPIPPEALHHVEVTGPMRMQVEFYREPPLG
jgi:hemoglobin